MHRIDLNVARSHVGHKVNLYLKDGSVIVNVLVTNAGRNLHGREPKRGMLQFSASTNGRAKEVPLNDIEWVEPVLMLC